MVTLIFVMFFAGAKFSFFGSMAKSFPLVIKIKVRCASYPVFSWLLNCFAKASKNESMRCCVRPKSAMEVIVVTGVSPVTVTLAVFSSTSTASIVMIELYAMKLAFVLTFAWCAVSSISSIVHSKLARAFGIAAQISVRG